MWGPFSTIEYFFFLGCLAFVTPFALKGVTLYWRNDAYAVPPPFWFYSARMWRAHLRSIPVVVGFIAIGVSTMSVIAFEAVTGTLVTLAYVPILAVAGLYFVLVLTTACVGRPRILIPPYMR